MGLRSDRGSGFGQKHQMPGAKPRGASSQPFFKLADALPFECLDRHRWRWDHPAARLAFRFPDDPLPLDRGERLPHRQGAVFKVNVFPVQAQRFALP